MGQAESLSISGGDGHRYWVSINSKPMKRGGKKTIHKARLLGHGPRQGEKVVAKSFTDIEGTKEAWTHEVTKADVTKQLVTKFNEACPSAPRIRIVLPGIVEMDKVSKFENWREGRGGHRGLSKDEWISIEEYITGQMSRYCPWSTSRDVDDVAHSDDLQTFSHFTYMHSCESLVACDFQGVVRTKQSSRKTLYIVTDSIIHSRYKMYGVFDKGDYGITEFFKLHKCTDICKDWPRPTPLTPPPSFDDACAALLMNNITPPPQFENIVFPAYQGEEGATGGEGADGGLSRRRHRSAKEVRHRIRPQGSDQLEVEEPESLRRRSHSDADMSLASYLMHRHFHESVDDPNAAVMTPPPAYESVVVPPLQDVASPPTNNTVVPPVHRDTTQDVSSETAVAPEALSRKSSSTTSSMDELAKVTFALSLSDENSIDDSSVWQEDEFSGAATGHEHGHGNPKSGAQVSQTCMPPLLPLGAQRPSGSSGSSTRSYNNAQHQASGFAAQTATQHRVLAKSNSGGDHNRLYMARQATNRHRHASEEAALRGNPHSSSYSQGVRQHQSLRHVLSNEESSLNREVHRVHRSATDSSIQNSDGRPRSISDANAQLRRAASPLMQRRMNNERENSSEERRNCQELPTLIVPSAPPMEFCDVSFDTT
ncbi:uncharacterized protein LOC101847676 [Aplysia californica]|uniref:Uncharacterized protein LOC101847676 n=1 Tax=Aplysia californica TaxID=6500 RepID=A0ABM0JZD3_APLCA|nr:uncharacterized protein LOC101847676 [Aplysia californica]